MNRFLDLLQQSVIIQGVTTVIWFVVTGILLIQKIPVDQQWYLFGIAIMAFWFGGKAVIMAQNTMRKKVEYDKLTER
jgi:hypothetical protein